jgi:hypothetical protein
MSSFEIEDTTNVILSEIVNPKMKQIDVAKTCAIAIMSGANTDWKQVNLAIINRWSKSARERVLTMAWKIAEQEEVARYQMRNMDGLR